MLAQWTQGHASVNFNVLTADMVGREKREEREVIKKIFQGR